MQHMFFSVLLLAAAQIMPGSTPARCPNAYVPAKLVEPVLPNVPQRSLETGLKHATVLLNVSLDQRGRPGAVKMQRSSGAVDIDTAALNLAQLSGYDAEVRGCAPTSGSYTLKVDFDVTRKDAKDGGGIDLQTHAFLLGTSCPTDHGVILTHAAVLPALHVPGNPKNTKEGTATISVSVDATGKVTAASVQDSTGSPALDRAAVTLAQNGDYLPAVYGCKSISGTYHYVAVFHRS